MKQITIYESDSGRRFDREGDCAAFEAWEARVNRVLSMLPKPKLEHGCGYRHNDKALSLALDRAAELIFESRVCGADFTPEKIRDSLAHSMSYLYRYLYETDHAVSLFFRFAKFNGNVEYDQPYFALHPEEALDVICTVATETKTVRKFS